MPNPHEAPREVAHFINQSAGISSHKTHPMLIIAAVAVTLCAGVGIAVMTGVIPSANSSASPKLESSTPPIPTAMGASAMMGSAGSNAASEAAPWSASTEKQTENKPSTSANSNSNTNTKVSTQAVRRPSSANTHPPSHAPIPVFAQNNSSAQAESVASFVPAAPTVVTICRTCGSIDSINTIVKQGEGSGAGVVLGGVLGGVLGHQVGNGRGKDLATVAGAVGGAMLGNSVEKNAKTANSYDVRVRMEDGTFQTVRYQTEPGLRLGDKVRVEDGRIVRG